VLIGSENPSDNQLGQPVGCSVLLKHFLQVTCCVFSLHVLRLTISCVHLCIKKTVPKMCIRSFKNITVVKFLVCCQTFIVKYAVHLVCDAAATLRQFSWLLFCVSISTLCAGRAGAMYHKCIFLNL